MRCDAVCKVYPGACIKLPATQTLCGDVYVYNNLVIQYKEDVPSSCTNMCAMPTTVPCFGV